MFDALFSVYGQLHKPVFDSKYAPDQAITSATLSLPPNAKRLTVLFPPWHMPDWYHRKLVKKLANEHSATLAYSFNTNILDADILTVKSSFEFIALAIAEDVRLLCKKYDLKEVNLMGFSIGNVAMCITAEKLDQFNKVLMVVPGSELAAAFWYGWRTRRLRNVIISEGHQLRELQEQWIDLAPESHAERLKDHPVQIILARKDKFIPYAYGHKLADELSALDPQVSFVTRPFGHIYTALEFVETF